MERPPGASRGPIRSEERSKEAPALLYGCRVTECTHYAEYVFEHDTNNHSHSGLYASIGEDRAQKRHYMIPPFFEDTLVGRERGVILIPGPLMPSFFN
jgi:hypothetical protein